MDKNLQGRQYTEQKFYDLLADNIKMSIYTSLVVKVAAVNLANQTVDVQPVIKAKIIDDKSKNYITNRFGDFVPVSDVLLAVIKNVPISHQRAGKYSITLPIAINDTGLLIISCQDLDEWKSKGGEATQNNLGLFDINNGIFFPFVPNQLNKDSNYNNQYLELKSENVKLTIKPSSIDIIGDVNVTGTLTASVDVVGGGKNLKTHTHSVSVPSTPYRGSTGAPS